MREGHPSYVKPPPGPQSHSLGARAHGAGWAFVGTPASNAWQCAMPLSLPQQEPPVRVWCVLTQKDDKVTPEALLSSCVAILCLVVSVPQMVYLWLLPEYFSSDCSMLFLETWPFSLPSQRGCKVCLWEGTEGEV